VGTNFDDYLAEVAARATPAERHQTAAFREYYQAIGQALFGDDPGNRQAGPGLSATSTPAAPEPPARGSAEPDDDGDGPSQ
jgi:hypothetical protein